MSLFISVIVLFAVIGFFTSSAALFWTLRFLKVKGLSYKKSLFIYFIAIIVGFLVNSVFAFLFPTITITTLGTIATFLVLWYLLNKYYQITWMKSLGIYIISLVTALLTYFILIFITYLFIGQVVSIAGIGMNPTYKNGDVVLVNILDKRLNRGDVVIFYPPNIADYQIGRIIGLPSDEMTIRDGQVLINNSPFTENYSIGTTSGDLSIALINDQYFIMGDNRSNSFDSIEFGPVDKSSIVGKVFDTIYTSGE